MREAAKVHILKLKTKIGDEENRKLKKKKKKPAVLKEKMKPHQ